MDISISAPYLLEWLNLERITFGRNRHLFSFSDVMEEGLLYTLLGDIDGNTFQIFGEVGSKQKMDILEKYVEREFGKRIKWAYKQNIGDFTQDTHTRELSKLICYFAIHSKKKNDYVGRILTLSEETQRWLMQQMQRMQAKMENITEIKQIIEQIQYLEYENEELKNKLQEMARVNTQMLNLLKQTEQQNKQYKKQIQQYRKQKIQVFSALQISEIGQYLQVFMRQQAQTTKYILTLQQIQQKLEESQENVVALGERIRMDSMVIVHLNDQITRLKDMYSSNGYSNESGEWSSSKLSMLKSVGSNNKENMSKCSTLLGKSMEIPTEWLNQDTTQKDQLRVHNSQLATSLQQMQKKYSNLSQETSQLRENNGKLIKSNANLKTILREIENQYEIFQQKYRGSIAADRIRLGRQCL